jgi:hypothetical protein
VGDDELVLAGEGREGGGGTLHVRALGLGGHRLVSSQQRVSAERDDEAH